MIDKLYNEINEIVEECSEPDWDGYGANPVCSKAARHLKALLIKLPDYIETPDVTPDNGGGIGLEWRRNKSIATLGVDSSGKIFWAYVLLNGRRGSKSFPWSLKIPVGVLDILIREFHT